MLYAASGSQEQIITMSVPIPPNETARLQALQQHQILDTAPEVAFERLTQLAARILNVPMAGVSLLDAKREWFKSSVGWAIRQTARDQAFCAHTILMDEVMVVPDATQDPRFVDNPLVTGPPHIRFYAGAPLKTPDGYNLGTLSILDVRPRQLNASEIATLTDLAAIVMDELELRSAAHTTRAQRRAGEEHLRQAEEKYRGIFEHATEGIFQTSLEGRYLSANPALARIYGYDSPTELMAHITAVGQQLYVVPERRDEFMRLMHERDRVSGFESEIRCKSGATVWISENARAVRDAQGDLLFYEGSVADITDRKRAEVALERARDHLQAVLDAVAGGVSWIKSDLTYLGVNQHLAALYGLMPADFVGQPLGVLGSSSEFNLLAREFFAGAAKTVAREIHMEVGHPGGPHAPCVYLVVAQKYDADEAAVFVGLDITARQQSEVALQQARAELEARVEERTAQLAQANTALRYEVEEHQQAALALRESEARFRSLVENAADAFFVLDGRGHIVDANQLACARLSYTREEMLQLSVYDLDNSMTPERFGQRWQEIAANGLNTLETEHRRQDGTTFSVEVRSSRFESGGIYLMLSLARDITRRKQAEAALQRAAQENSQLAAAINNLAAGVLITDPRLPDNPTIFANPGFTAITGYQPAEIIGRNCRFLQGPDTNPLAVQQIREAIEQQRLLTITLLNYRKDGTPFWNEFTINPVYDEAGELTNFVGIQTDVTERVQAAEALRSQNRLALFAAEVGTILTEGAPLQVTLQRCAQSMAQHLDAAFARIWTLDAAEHSLHLQASVGLYTHLDGPHSRVPVGQFKIGLIAAERQPHVTNAVLEDPRVGDQEWARREGLVAFAGYPLLAQDQVVGVMALFARQPLNDATLQVIATAANGLALAIQRHQAEVALRASEARLRALVQSLDDIVFELDDQGTYINVWAGEEGLLVRPRAEYVGRRITDVLGEATGRPFIAAFQRVISTGETETIDYALQYQGSLRWFAAHIRPIHLADGSCRTVCMLSRDVTQHKQAALALQQAKDEAERANRAKSEFLSRMSHELRTPLNAILGFGQLFELDEMSVDDRENIEQILRAGQHLLGLINEVLDVARIESGQLTLSLEPINVAAIVEEVLGLIQPLATQRHIRISKMIASPHFYVMADQLRLKQILLNLLSNAIKYNHDGGQAAVACVEVQAAPGDAPEQGGRLRLEVSDTGPGIAAEDITKLFRAFERLGADRDGIEGTGIGLALSQRLAQLMGAEIGVRSVRHEGSTFWIEFQRAADPQGISNQLEEVATPAARSVAPAVSATTPPGRTVLYIEDNLANLKLVERVLAVRSSIQLLSAMQGQVGIDLARQHRPDLILLDLHLPDMDGDEVLPRLLEYPETKGIPVVMLSADATPGQAQRLLNAGARAYLTKPLDIQRFMTTLDDIFQA